MTRQRKVTGGEQRTRPSNDHVEAAGQRDDLATDLAIARRA
jgi:hypothetical protein